MFCKHLLELGVINKVLHFSGVVFHVNQRLFAVVIVVEPHGHACQARLPPVLEGIAVLIIPNQVADRAGLAIPEIGGIERSISTKRPEIPPLVSSPDRQVAVAQVFATTTEYLNIIAGCFSLTRKTDRQAIRLPSTCPNFKVTAT